MKAKQCWVVCDAGKIGTENQCVGLAESLGFQPVIKHVAPRFPWTHLPPHLWFSPLKALIPGQDLTPPWPELIIGAGRVSVAPTAAIRKLTKGQTQVVQLQNPTVNPKLFDAVVAPAHDCLKGDNVIETQGALHRVTPERLAQDREKFKHLVGDLPRPLVTVLIGGTNKCYQMTPEVIKSLAARLKALGESQKVGFAITFSRRTEEKNRKALREGLQGVPSVIWEGEGENPYFGFLGLADYIIVTCDSVSMASEACATGKPVFIYPLPGGSRKFRRFHDFFKEKGYTRPFEDTLSGKTAPLLDERVRVLSKLKNLLNIE